MITPDVRSIAWDGFGCGQELLKAGEEAALATLPKIQAWLAGHAPRQNGTAHSHAGLNTGMIARHSECPA